MKHLYVALFFIARVAVADEVANPARVEARRLHQLAVEAASRGDYAEVIARLEEAHRAFPLPEGERNIASAQNCWVMGSLTPGVRISENCDPVPAGRVAPEEVRRVVVRRIYNDAVASGVAGNYAESIRGFDQVQRILPHSDTLESRSVSQACWVRLTVERQQNVEGCAPVTGDRNPPPELVQAIQGGRALHVAGISSSGEGRYQAALDSLEQAYRLVPHENTRLALEKVRSCWARASRVPVGDLGDCAALAAGEKPMQSLPAPAPAALTRRKAEREQAAPNHAQEVSSAGAPSVSCDLVEIARRDGGEGHFNRDQARSSMGFGNRQGSILNSSPGVNLSSGVSIQIITPVPSQSSDPWTSSVQFRPARSGAPVRLIPVAPNQDGSCPSRPLPIRMAVNGSAEQLLSDLPHQALEFSDADLQPGQRSPLQRRCFAVNDPTPRSTQKYYELNCAMTRRRQPRAPLVTGGDVSIESAGPSAGSAAPVGQ